VTTFPRPFEAVNSALRSAGRAGRPAKKAVLSLVLMHPRDQLPAETMAGLGEVERADVEHKWLSVYNYRGGWAVPVLSEERDAGLLESEWQLRLVAVGAPFVASLLTPAPQHEEACLKLLEALQQTLGPGTWRTTRDAYAGEMRALVDAWPDTSAVDLAAFWAKGQARWADYEGRLQALLSGYNTGGEGFLGYRPDFVVTPFRPCSILEATSDDTAAINVAIRRDAHGYEFVALADPTVEAARAYLAEKLPNCVEIVREQ
jgi:hypothetical protein